jgi:hypothetical protein
MRIEWEAEILKKGYVVLCVNSLAQLQRRHSNQVRVVVGRFVGLELAHARVAFFAHLACKKACRTYALALRRGD